MQRSDVKIVTLQPMNLLAVGHVGPYTKIGDAFFTLAQWLGARRVPTSRAKLVGIFYDDPNQVEPSKLRSKAAIHLPDTSNLTPGSPVEKMQLRGGAHAMLLHKGPYDGLGAVWTWFYADWLPKSGRKADVDAPSFELYLNTPEEVAPDELLTELYLPLV
ncbi:GyrI-like domain-containing protein [Paraburkholderia sp.]|uniref:AraC family transcriptional regulator n=1 Tax=Paraburkholderia sp. TaxID=1926495 RepID=UPI0025E52C0C|nr:GyrI-like domain-containing protein [Paraburkholderia sp.]